MRFIDLKAGDKCGAIRNDGLIFIFSVLTNENGSLALKCNGYEKSIKYDLNSKFTYFKDFSFHSDLQEMVQFFIIRMVTSLNEISKLNEDNHINIENDKVLKLLKYSESIYDFIKEGR
jgi:hypothetical protein